MFSSTRKSFELANCCVIRGMKQFGSLNIFHYLPISAFVASFLLNFTADVKM